jgi:hypothetical protein
MGKVLNLEFLLQALSMSLAGRVGTGNIAGVATAIAFWWTWSHVLDVDGCFFRSKYRLS